MTTDELPGILAFLRTAEGLKNTLRSGFTSSGRRESTAEHTWRLCLMAVVLREHFPDVDLGKLLRMLIVHDLGEVLQGDVPAPAQRGSAAKARERRDFAEVVRPLPAHVRQELLDLREEYEGATTPEARLAKGLDKLETILQHTQGQNPADFDYAFNLEYGQAYTSADPWLAAIRALIDPETAKRAAARGDLSSRAP
jgi:putative hydrolase of HD superfamily